MSNDQSRTTAEGRIARLASSLITNKDTDMNLRPIVMTDTSRDAVENMCRAARFADSYTGIPKIIATLRALLDRAERAEAGIAAAVAAEREACAAIATRNAEDRRKHPAPAWAGDAEAIATLIRIRGAP